jgi:MerR family transcriptional regulator, copper efflux regulator
MDGLRISEVAERTGFSAPTLRYYETIGLLPAPARTESGYRRYDHRTVELLRFVARAKSLGLSLDETRELAGLWADDRCRPVQERLTELLRDKLGAAHAQIAELTAFTRQLESVSATLGRHVNDGPCDDQCGCTTDRALIACTLAPEDVAPRLTAWHALLERAERVDDIGDGVRVHFGHAVRASDVAGLAHDEQSCCSFLTFAVIVDHEGVALDVHAPADARPVIDALIPRHD